MSLPAFPPRVRGKRGIVAPDKNGFRAEVCLDGTVAAGPRRIREVDANVDLARVRACPPKRIPGLLARLCGRAAAGKTPPPGAALMSPGGNRSSLSVASRSGSDVGSLAVSRRKRAVGATSRQSSTDSTGHSVLPRNLESEFRRAARKRRRCKSAGPTPAAAHSSRLLVAAGASSSGVPVRLLLRGLNIQYPFSRLILAGLKDTEVRDYALGYRNIARPDEEMFLLFHRVAPPSVVDCGSSATRRVSCRTPWHFVRVWICSTSRQDMAHPC